MRRFPCEMSHVPNEQLGLMADYLQLQREAATTTRRDRMKADVATAEQALTDRIEEAERRWRGRAG